MTVGWHVDAVDRGAVRTTAAAAVSLATYLLGAFALAALVNELDIGWPWWVVASVVAVVSPPVLLGCVAMLVYVALFFTWLWHTIERTRRSGLDDVAGDVLPRKSTPPIATAVGLFAISAGVPGISTSLDNSSPGSFLAYAVPVGLGMLSFVMGLMLARYRRKQLDIIRQSFVRQVEEALMGRALNDIDYLIRQRDALIASGDVSDATDMSFQIREVLIRKDAVKRTETPPPSATRPPRPAP